MNVHGTWVVTVSGPGSRLHLVVEVTAGPGGLAATATVQTEQVTLADVLVAGDHLSWVQPPTRALPVELAVGLRVRGDIATGHGRAPGLPAVSVIGMRSTTK
ncbi:MAG: hypothetical protein OEW29_18680 [Acidimicrobiia bacterium]|nr:hypothetical protein [Acidimicrobiia bacterium]